MKFNINNTVRVKLTDVGRNILKQEWEVRHAQYPAVFRVYSEKEEDADGWSTWQLWQLFEHFGEHISLSARLPFEAEIEIPE